MHSLATHDPRIRDGSFDLATTHAALAGDALARLRVVDCLMDLPAMLRIKNVRLGSPLRPHELDDVAQDVLLALWGKLDRYDGRAPLRHWAYGFGVVEIRRAIERRARQREQPIDDASLVVDDSRGAPHDHEPLRRLLAELDQSERDVIHLKHFEALTFDEISLRLAIATNTAKTRYYRGLGRLRRRLPREPSPGI